MNQRVTQVVIEVEEQQRAKHFIDANLCHWRPVGAHTTPWGWAHRLKIDDVCA